jgi:hypothetical protein
MVKRKPRIGRPLSDPETKRSRGVTVWLTEGEYRKVQALAEHGNLSMSAWFQLALVTT